MNNLQHSPPFIRFRTIWIVLQNLHWYSIYRIACSGQVPVVYIIRCRVTGQCIVTVRKDSDLDTFTRKIETVTHKIGTHRAISGSLSYPNISNRWEYRHDKIDQAAHGFKVKFVQIGYREETGNFQ